MDALTSPKAPKHTQIFTKKREAPFLFYKFYKFRRNLLFNYMCLRAYRQQMGTEKQQMGTEKQQMGTNLHIDRQHLIAEMCCHDENHANSR
jgi:hypothetical protein